MAYNDDISGSSSGHSRIERELDAGAYTLEATTYATRRVGSFTVRVQVCSNDAALNGLSLSPASASLTPDFAADEESYTARVGNAVTSVQVTPIVNQANATVTVNRTTATSGQPSGPISLAVGTNTITVVVTAQDGSTTKTYTVVVTRSASALINRAPTANAGPDQRATVGTRFTLDGSDSSDPDDDTLTYAWTQGMGPKVSLSGANTSSASFIVPSTSGPITFSLMVTDPDGLSDTDLVTLTAVSTPPPPPVTSWQDTGNTRGCGPTKEKEQSRTSGGSRQTRWVSDPEPEIWGPWSRTSATRGSCSSRQAQETRTSNCANTQTQWVSDPEPEIWGPWSRTGSTQGSCSSRQAQETRTSNCANTQTQWVSDPEPETWGSWSDTGRTETIDAYTWFREQQRTSNCGNTETRWVAGN